MKTSIEKNITNEKKNIKKKANGRRSPLGIAVNAVCILLFIASLALLAATLLLRGDEPTSLFGHYLFRVSTGSMEPTIRTGSVIVVKKTDTEKIRVGDIITFMTDDPEIKGSCVTHRVIGTIRSESGETLSFITKGDANETRDDYPARANSVLGVVRHESHKAGEVYDFLSRRGVSFCVTILPLIILVIIAFVDLVVLVERSKHEPSDASDTSDNENDKDKTDK